MKTRPTLARAAILTSCAFAEMPAKLPEFMNSEQLAKWRAETAAENAAKAASEPSELDVRSSKLDVPTPFFTGKPFIESTGTYAFKYRSYNPVLARWTSEDPSGFPDGSNNTLYAQNCASFAIDPLGLATRWITGSFTMTASWKEIKTETSATSFSLSFPLSVQISVTTSNLWEKWGPISTTKTSGEFAENATPPSGWAWVDAPNTIINPTSFTQDGAAKYSPEYQYQIGTSTVTVMGAIVSSTPVYATMKDGSWKVSYNWQRLAQE